MSAAPPPSPSRRGDAPPEPSRRRVATRAAVGTLGGFVARRVIDVLVLWLVGRLASREAIGLFRSWQAVVVPLTVVIAGGWDTAFLRRRRNKPAAFRVLAWWTSIAAGVLGIALVAGAPMLTAWFDDPPPVWLFRLGGIAFAAEAVRRAIRPVLADERRFGVITSWELLRSLVYGVGAIGALLFVLEDPTSPGAIVFVAAGFVVSYLVADVIEALGLLFVQRRRGAYPLDRRPGRHVELWRAGRAKLGAERRRAVWRGDRRFAGAVTTDALLNALGVYLPVFLLGRWSGNEAVAFYSYALAIIAIPLNLLLDAVQRVLLPSLADLPPERQAAGVLQVAEVMALVTLPLLVWIGVFAPELFALLLGASWRPAGDMTRCLLLFLVFAPTTHLCTTILALRGRPDVGVVWNAATFAGRVVVLWIGLERGGPLAALLLYGLHGAGMYLLYQRQLGLVLGLGPWSYVRTWARYAWTWVALGLAWWAIGRQHPEMRLAELALIGVAGGAFYVAALAIVHRPAFQALVGLWGHLRRDRRDAAPVAADVDATMA